VVTIAGVVQVFQPRRLAAALGVLLFHAAILTVLAWTTFRTTAPVPVVREMILELTRPPVQNEPEHAPPVPLQRPIVPRENDAIPSPPTTSGSTLQGLHLLLFDCAPENRINLSQEQQAQCESASMLPKPDDAAAVQNRPTRALDAARWARERARKNAPLLLPCFDPQGINPVYTLFCLGDGAINGFHLDDLPSYSDPPPLEARVPNNGDPQLEPAHH
jgi:hypothetical protein